MLRVSNGHHLGLVTLCAFIRRSAGENKSASKLIQLLAGFTPLWLCDQGPWLFSGCYRRPPAAPCHMGFLRVAVHVIWPTRRISPASWLPRRCDVPSPVPYSTGWKRVAGPASTKGDGVTQGMDVKGQKTFGVTLGSVIHRGCHRMSPWPATVPAEPRQSPPVRGCSVWALQGATSLAASSSAPSPISLSGPRSSPLPCLCRFEFFAILSMKLPEVEISTFNLHPPFPAPQPWL